MLLLWVLWRKGFVVASVRQPSTEDDGHDAPDERPAPAGQGSVAVGRTT